MFLKALGILLVAGLLSIPVFRGKSANAFIYGVLVLGVGTAVAAMFWVPWMMENSGNWLLSIHWGWSIVKWIVALVVSSLLLFVFGIWTRPPGHNTDTPVPDFLAVCFGYLNTSFWTAYAATYVYTLTSDWFVVLHGLTMIVVVLIVFALTGACNMMGYALSAEDDDLYYAHA